MRIASRCFPLSQASQVRYWIARLMTLLLLAALAACGGGGGGDGSSIAFTGDGGSGTGSGTGTSATFSITADREQVATGGAPVMLSASIESATGIKVEWTLAPDSPGSLSQTVGTQVEYIPPAAGAPVANNIVTISASNGSVSANLVIVLVDNQGSSAGTAGATTATPSAPVSTAGTTAPTVPTAPTAAAGIYLVAGNDFGAGMANGPGTAARFDAPSGIARDAQGNVYIADRLNNVVRKIDVQGNVTTFAGMPGERGYVDASGSDARFSLISGIAIDGAGNIYIDDYGNSLIRKIKPDGTVITLAGTPGLSGDRDGPAGTALFSGSPSALTVDDAGNVYVAEPFDVRKIAPDGTVGTVAGRSASSPAGAGFASLNGIAIDGAHNIYVTDGGWLRLGSLQNTSFRITAAIRKIAPNGTITTLAGAESDNGATADVLGHVDGPGAQARFSYPQGLAIDGVGNLYVADRGNHMIRKIAPDGTVSTVAGTEGPSGSADGPVADASFASPFGIALGAENALYVTDSTADTIRKILPGDSVSTVAGAAPRTGSADGSGSGALFSNPHGIGRDASGALYVADTGNQTIRKIVGAQVTTAAGTPGQTGTTDGAGAIALFNRPLDVVSDAGGNLFVTDFSNHTVRRIASTGVVTTYAGMPGDEAYADGPAASAGFVEPQAAALDSIGNLYVADRAGDAIRKITPQGIVSTLFGHQDTSSSAPFGFGNGQDLLFPLDVAVDKDGNVYTIDSNTAIRKITPNGTMTTLAGIPFAPGTQDGAGSAARFNFPQSLTVDDQGNVYVGDLRAIRKITPQGVVTTVAGASVQSDRLHNIYQPDGLVMTGANSLAFTSGNGVFELRLP